MDKLNQHLNLIRQHGTAEQLEETHLLFQELVAGVNKDIKPLSKTEKVEIRNWVEFLEALQPELEDPQLEMLESFLEYQAKEIISRRERDITLI